MGVFDFLDMARKAKEGDDTFRDPSTCLNQSINYFAFWPEFVWSEVIMNGIRRLQAGNLPKVSECTQV